jgi:Ca2+-binding RTX toxin-like protein
MARTIRFTNGDDSFRQGFAPENTRLTLVMGGGKDSVLLDRDDDLGGLNRVLAGAGDDSVISRIEQGNVISLGAGNDIYVSTGFGSFATDRGDRVSGGAGRDTFAVSTFQSTYLGGTGNDIFHSVGWQNTFVGGKGRDTISYEPRADDFTQGGSGVTVDLGAGRTQTGANRFETLRGIENAIGSGADDALFGTNGRNVLTGGLGFDQLTGRGGADTFVWRSAAEATMASDAIDLVTDFSTAQRDRIDLRGIDADATTRANDAFDFIGAQGFSGTAGELRFAGQILEGDTNGDGLADFRIGLLNVDTLGASDILL